MGGSPAGCVEGSTAATGAAVGIGAGSDGLGAGNGSLGMPGGEEAGM